MEWGVSYYVGLYSFIFLTILFLDHCILAFHLKMAASNCTSKSSILHPTMCIIEFLWRIPREKNLLDPIIFLFVPAGLEKEFLLVVNK